MHVAITKAFKKYHLFGFTGTPIFAVNANAGTKHANLKTTEQAFGEKLHTYTIVNAINDKNVLPFRIDYIKTMDKEPDIDDKQVADIDREKAFNAPVRIRKIVDYILDNFNRKTYRNEKAILSTRSQTYRKLLRRKTQKPWKKSNRNCAFRDSTLFSAFLPLTRRNCTITNLSAR